LVHGFAQVRFAPPHPLPNKELTNNYLTNLLNVLTCTVTSLNTAPRPLPQTFTAPHFSQSGPTFLTPLFSQPSVLPSLQPLCFDNHLDCLCLKLPNPALRTSTFVLSGRVADFGRYEFPDRTAPRLE